MAKSFKFKSNLYLDTKGIMHARTLLYTFLNSLKSNVDSLISKTKDSGYVAITKFGTGVDKYQDGYMEPVYRKVGQMVEVEGACTLTAAASAGATVTLFTLPSGYRPKYQFNFLCQGSGSNKWLCAIDGNGNVAMSRYGGTSNVAVPTGVWLPFHVTFFVE